MTEENINLIERKKPRLRKKKEPEPEPDFGRSLPTPDLSLLSIKTKQELESIYKDVSIEIENCRLCPLANARMQTVMSRGDISSKIVFIGEAPGRDENIKGLPFVGKSGKYIDYLLDIVGIDVQKIIYINTLKCQPPNNIFPAKSIAGICIENHLWRQLDLIRPRAICLLGLQAAKMVLGFSDKAKAGDIVGKAFKPPPRISGYCEEVFVTYHPAFILRKPDAAPIVAEHLECFKTDLKIMGLLSEDS